MPASSFPEGDARGAASLAPGAAAGAAATPVRVRVWDLPLRLFHWLLVLCLVGSFVSVKAGGYWMDWHFRFGYTALGLLVFRILWGFVGPRYARFESFAWPPSRLVAYLRGGPDAPQALGHTPLGALSVFAMLLAIGVQAATGLFTSDEIATEGPLARAVSNATVATASSVHHFNQNLILVLVGLHLLALLFYRLVRRLSLVKPMVVGDKLVAPAVAGPDPAGLAARDDTRVRLRAAIVAGVAAALVAAVVNWPG
jgi:cytochrome b